jgi:hypothetical protein
MNVPSEIRRYILVFLLGNGRPRAFAAARSAGTPKTD